jgi:Protein of unknown function (DUF1566)
MRVIVLSATLALIPFCAYDVCGQAGGDVSEATGPVQLHAAEKAAPRWSDGRTDLAWTGEAARTMTLEEASDYCKNLVLDGAKRWYLPTRDQLEVLHKHITGIDPLPLRVTGRVWSASPTVLTPAYETVNPATGEDGFSRSDWYLRVMCVRRLTAVSSTPATAPWKTPITRAQCPTFQDSVVTLDMRPEYPADVRYAQGRGYPKRLAVTVAATVTADGAAAETSIAESDCRPEEVCHDTVLDRAQSIVKRLAFHPATCEGRPGSSRRKVQVIFEYPDTVRVR